MGWGDGYKKGHEDLAKFAGKVAAAPYDTAQALAPNATTALTESAKRVALGGTVGIGGQAYGALHQDPRTMQSFQRDPAQEPTTLSPMASPDVNVQPVAPLDPRMSSFRQTLMGGGGIGQGGGLKGAWMDARKKILGDYETDKELAGRAGVAKGDRIDATADLMSLDAAQREREAQIDARADQMASDKHQQMLARNQQLATDIGKMQIDPKRLLKSQGAGDRIANVIGSAFGGALRGLQGGANQTLARLNHEVDLDISAQERAIDNKKAELGAKTTIFGQMLAETGDRRLARMQTRNLMMEASKQKLMAEADRLGIPEVLANADQVRQGIQHTQDAQDEQYKKEAYVSAQQAAAAQAAAQKAAEKELFERQMRIGEFGLKKDQLEIDRAKAMGTTAEDINKQTQALGKELSDKDLAEGRGAVENAKRRFTGLKQDEGLAGVGQLADARAALKPEGLNKANPLMIFANKVAGLSDEERVSRGDWEKVKLAYQKQITGSGASTEERKMLSQAFEGAKSPAEQRNAIAQAEGYFKQRESAIKAGFDPRAVATFEARQNAINPQLPASVTVKK